MPKIKLGARERLKLPELRAFTRLQPFRIVELRGPKVVLECETHGMWEVSHQQVLAKTALCPKCHKLGERDAWDFDVQDWRAVLRVLQPKIRYADKYESVGGRHRYRHKCRICSTVFRNSQIALRHKKFQCPGCAFSDWQPSIRQVQRAEELRGFLQKSRYAYARYRKHVVHLQELSIAYAELKRLGTVPYPPQIDVPELKLWKDWEPRFSDLRLPNPKRRSTEKKPVMDQERGALGTQLEQYLEQIGRAEEKEEEQLLTFVEPSIELEVEVLEQQPEEEDYPTYSPPRPAVGVWIGRSGRRSTGYSQEFMSLVREVNSMNGVSNADN